MTPELMAVIDTLIGCVVILLVGLDIVGVKRE
jgi:hypothetical protein